MTIHYILVPQKFIVLSSRMLRAIIFDFNGVIADDETSHFLAFQQALREQDLLLTKEAYYGGYLGMDERICAADLLKAATGASDRTLLQRIADRKAALFEDHTARHKPRLFPGIVPFVKQAGTRYRLAIASGGRKAQIEAALQGTPIENDFAVVISAEDTLIGKPDPEVYRLALARLDALGLRPALTPDECLVIEDSRAGIQAAMAAKMNVIALATTYPAAQLTEAHLVIQALDDLSLDRLNGLFG